MKKINILLLVLTFASVFSFNVKQADACSYIYQTASQRLESSDLVFKGTVTAFTQAKVSANNRDMNLHTITLKLNTYWKGTPSEYVTITSSSQVGVSCYPATASVGKEYMIYAHKDVNGAYTVNEVEVQDMAYIQSDIAAIGPGTSFGSPTPVTPTQPTNPVNQCLLFSKDVKLGNSGAEVVNVQTYLMNKGFTIASLASGATAKGYFGAQSVTALKKYQKSIGVAQTGKLDVNTRKKMNALCASPVPNSVSNNAVINSQPAPVVSVNNPLSLFAGLKISSNKIKVGESYAISWTYNGSVTDTKPYYLYYMTDSMNGGSGEIGFISNPKLGVYNWTVAPSLYTEVDQKVKFVISSKAPNVLTPMTSADIIASTDYVTLEATKLTAELALVAPSYKGKIAIGQPYTFTWASNNIPAGSVYSIGFFDGQRKETILTSGVITSGFVTVPIPPTITPGFYEVFVSVKFPNSSEKFDIRHSAAGVIEFTSNTQTSKSSILEFTDYSLDFTADLNKTFVKIVPITGNTGKVTYSPSQYIDGLSFKTADDSSLLIIGTPKVKGYYKITVQATDSVSGKKGSISGNIFVY